MVKESHTLVPFRLAEATVDLLQGGASNVRSNAGPPQRVDGFNVGAPVMTREPPHDGEMHPDGDELLFLISGSVDVHVETDGGEQVVALAPGDAFIVPKGVWHRVKLREPSQLVHVTPGPGGEHRPRRR